MNKLRNSLSKKSLLALLVVLLPVVIAFFIGYNSTKNQLRSLIFNGLITMSEAYEGQIYQFLEMSKRRAQDFASDGFIIDELQKIAGGDQKASLILSKHLINNKKTLDKTIHDIHMLIGDRIVASTDSSAIGEDLPKKLSINSINLKPVTVEAIFLNMPSLMVFAPVISRATGRTIGVLAYSMNISELNRVMKGDFVKDLGAITWKSSGSKTLDAYIVNKDGFMITGSSFIADAIFKQQVDTLPVQACIESNREIDGFYRDYRGVEVAGVSMCLPSLKWVLIVEIDKDEIWLPVLGLKKYAIMAGILVVGLIVILFFVFLDNVVNPLKRISIAANEIAKGRYNITLPVKNRDEIGSLSESFNIMAREIEARTSSLKKSEASLANAQRTAHLGNWDWDIVNNTLYWSDEIYHIFGLTPQEFGATYEAFLNYVHPEDRELLQRSVNEALHEKKPYAIDYRIVLPDGNIRIVHEQAETVRNEIDRPIRMIGTVQDVTEHKGAEAELIKLSAAIDHSVNVIFITDVKGVIDYVNPMFEKVTGWSREEAIGQNPRILASGETSIREYEELWQTIIAGKTWRGSFKNKRKDGIPYWGNAVITPIKSERGEITHFLAVQEDITEKKKTDERVKYLATYDEFTGLLNRTRFIEMLSEWIPDNQIVGQKAVLMLVDIDGFKDINDTFGHGIGDELIRYVAKLLEDTIMGADMPSDNKTNGAILGRLGGDEFAVFIPDVDANMGAATAERVRKSIEEFRFPALSIQLTVSIGVVSYPEHGKTAKELLTKVDAAIYRAKAFGRNRCHIYRPEDMDMENTRARVHQKIQIQKALEEGRFVPWFQPILDLRDNKVHHYEALARMQGEGGKIVFPNEFIDTAERFGMIGAIDRIITKRTMRLQAETGRSGRHYSFAMNLSGKNLGDEELLSFLQSMIEETGADPNNLIFEITETAAVQDLDKAVKFIAALKNMGCKFSLDDFGVGFTSFVYLREMNVDYIKIDGSFVKRLNENPDDQFIVKAIVGVAKGMGIKTVAEFVEKKETLDLLRVFGVDYAQGYFIGKPGPELLPDG